MFFVTVPWVGFALVGEDLVTVVGWGLAAGATVLAIGFARRAGRSARAELRAAARAAECEANLRTAESELVEAQRTRDAAEVASRRKSEFLAMMSHDLRTPVSAMIGSADLLLRSDPTADQRELLETLRAGGTSLLQILDDSLDLSRVEAGRLDLEIGPLRLRESLEDALDLCALGASAKSLDLVYEVADDVPVTLLSDAARLRQILVNLVGNAVKFTSAGEVVVSVSHHGGSERELEFAVRDTGLGIAQDRIGRIFDAYSQADVTTSRRFGGTGLGLAICRQLVDLMGGRIWVESAVGQGSVFRFTLPAGEDNDDTRPPPEPLSEVLVERRLLIIAASETLRRCLVAHGRALGLVAVAGDPETLASGDAKWDLVILESRIAAAQRVITDLSAWPAETRPALVLLTPGGNGARSVRPPPGALAFKLPIRLSRLRSLLEAAISRTRPAAGGRRTGLPMPVAGPGRKLRVLLAEDDPLNRTVALRMLSLLGCATDLAADGAEALGAARRDTYDLVLLDLQLPEVDGLEVARGIVASLPPDRRPQIVALTASTQPADREACRRAGMDGFLSKPLRFESLQSVVAACRSPEAARRATAEHPPGEPASDRVLDVQRLDHLRILGDRSKVDLVSSLVGRFLAEVDTRVTAVVERLAAGDADGLVFAAHSLKGSSAQLGAVRFAAVCGELERAAREGRHRDEGQALLGQLRVELDRVRPLLAAQVASPLLDSEEAAAN
ncbi:MAG: ATP-binding protein [Thermoanaerobaculia bacterium]|nr:ATP-binding protein [Thermoanaerobaculia bacterium]